jgi:hypothetical protein
MSLHCVNSVENCLDRMEGGASNGGLWVDFTIFFWLSEFIKRPIEHVDHTWMWETNSIRMRS